MRIAVFASGSGSNFEALAKGCEDGSIDGSIPVLVCDRPGAGVIDRAGRFPGIDVIVISPKDFPDRESFEREIVRLLAPYHIDLVCLAGYMRICGSPLLSEFKGRIINIHPSLLPAFKGAHAIKDAFEYGVKVFGVTIHHVDESLDGGTIIAQDALKYLSKDMEELTEMIHKKEHELYVSTVSDIAAGIIPLERFDNRTESAVRQ